MREDEESVILSTNVLFGVQSIMKKDDSLSGMYYDVAMAAPVLAGIGPADEGDVLILGMGTGTYAKQCLRYFPKLRVEGVEIDEKITELARTYFDEPEEAVVTTYDGRAYLQTIDRTYDVIMVDAFQDITIPFQMASVEFFSLVRDHLKPGGVMVINMNMRADGEGTINEYLQETIASVFTDLKTVDVTGFTNRILFASMDPLHTERLAADGTAPETNASAPEAAGQEELSRLMARIAEELTDETLAKEGDPAKAHILTDDRAPVELLSMRAIDQIISQELSYYKQVYRDGGIRAILREF